MVNQNPLDHEVRGFDTEKVLIAFAPNKRLIYFIEGNEPSRSQYAIRNGTALFDICIYIPRKKTWYHLTEGLREKAFKSISDRETYYMRNGVPSYLMGSTICFVSPGRHELFMYDLKTFTWKVVGYGGPLAESEKYFKIGESGYLEMGEFDQYFVCSDDQLYLFLVHEANNLNKGSYDCYVLSTSNSWRHFFSIPNTEDEEIPDFNDSKFSVAFSKTSSEMIIVYKIDKLHVYIVGLDTERPKTTMRSFEVDNIRIKGFNPFYMLEDGDYLAIVEELPNTEVQHAFHCVCRYKRQTNELITDRDTEIKDSRFYRKNHIHRRNQPCQYLLDTSDNKNIWMFEGNWRDGSSLKSLSFEGEDGLAVHSHTPPPFSCVSGMVAGDIKRDCLANLKPITKYLHEDVKG